MVPDAPFGEEIGRLHVSKKGEKQGMGSLEPRAVSFPMWDTQWDSAIAAPYTAHGNIMGNEFPFQFSSDISD